MTELTTNHFFYNEEDRTLSQEASTLEATFGAGIVTSMIRGGFPMKSSLTGNITRFKLLQVCHRDEDITHWLFKPETDDVYLPALIIWND